MAPGAVTGLAGVLAALDLQPEGEGGLRATNVDLGHPTVYGGQLMGQAVVAASRAVPDKEVLSLHTVFCRAASPESPLEVAVEVVHGGRSFATATVTASQDGRVCCCSAVLLHRPDPDRIRHSTPPPRLDPPADPPAGDRWWEVRVVDDVDLSDPDAVGPPELQVWTRFPGAPTDPVVARALLAWATDGFLIGTAMRPHPGVGQAMAHTAVATTVLTHTITFHEPFAAGRWLLLDQRSTYAGRGRARGTGEVYDELGRLVASFAQDSLIRAPGAPAGGAGGA